MRIDGADGCGINGILGSALLNKQDYDGKAVHDHLKSASMLKG